MKKKFEMSSLGEMSTFLGLQVKQESEGILVHQAKLLGSLNIEHTSHNTQYDMKVILRLNCGIVQSKL